MKKISLLSLSIGMLFILSFGFSGCTPIQQNINYVEYHDKSLKSGLQVIRTPELNLINKIEIGENMYKKSYLFAYDTFIVSLDNEGQDKILYKNDQSTQSTGGNSLRNNINELADAILPGTVEESNQYSEFSSDFKSSILYKTIDKNRNAMCKVNYNNYTNLSIESCLIDSNTTGYFTEIDLSTSDIQDLKIPIKYSIVQSKPTYVKDSFEYIVLYQGKIGNKIKLSFREFIETMARPAFTQEIEYELNGDKETIIGFKGLRIKVIEATNIDIKYQVLQDYH